MELELRRDGWTESDGERFHFAENVICGGFFELAQVLAIGDTGIWRRVRLRNRYARLVWEPNTKYLNISWGLSHDT